MKQPVERRQQRGPSRERLIQLRRINAPRSLYALDHRLFAGLADIDGLDRNFGRTSASNAEGSQPALVPLVCGFLQGTTGMSG
jgi:hypothetical protein